MPVPATKARRRAGSAQAAVAAAAARAARPAEAEAAATARRSRRRGARAVRSRADARTRAEAPQQLVNCGESRVGRFGKALAGNAAGRRFPERLGREASVLLAFAGVRI